MEGQLPEELVDIKKTYQGLERAGLKDSTKALITAVQQQVLNTGMRAEGAHQTGTKVPTVKSCP